MNIRGEITALYGTGAEGRGDAEDDAMRGFHSDFKEFGARTDEDTVRVIEVKPLMPRRESGYD